MPPAENRSSERLTPDGLGPKERIDRLVAEGRLLRQAVEHAEQVWRERLQDGVPMSNGEVVRITLDDLYHAIVDARIARRPERIESSLRGIFEVRRAEAGRRIGFSRWREAGGEQLGTVILEQDNTLRSVHIVEPRRLERYRRRYPEVLWRWIS